MQDLKIKLKLESDGFRKGLNDAKSAMESLNTSSSKGLKDLAGGFSNLTGKMGSFTNFAAIAFKGVKASYDLGIKANKEFVQDLKTAAGVVLKFGAAAGGAFALIAKEGMAFENEMAKVRAITGATDAEFQKLTQTARDWGSKTRYSATEVAEAMSYMGMAGWNATQITEGMSGVLNLATVGALDLGKASDIVTDGLTAMGLSASDVGDFTDMMTATITNANTSVELMGETMKYVGPVAGALGIEMEDLSVAIGLMGNSGIKGSQAGTALRAGLTKLIKPTDDAAAVMKKYGVEVVKNKDGTVNLAGTMENLRTTLGSLDAATQAQAVATIFGQEAMSGWMSIINAADGDVSKLSTAINGSTKAMQYWRQEMEKAGMSAEDIEKNLLTLDTVFEESKMTADYLGVSATDLAKIITMLGKDGKVASKDVEKLLNTMLLMKNPTDDMKKAMSDLGIEFKTFDNGAIDTAGTLESLRNGLKGLSDEEKANALAKMGLTDSQEELNEILSLSDKEFNDYIANLQETKGLTEKLAETMDATTTGSIKSMASAISDVLIEAFKSVKGPIQEFANTIAEAANLLKTQGLTAATQYLVDSFRTKIQELPQIMSETINFVVNAINENFPAIMQAAGELVQNFSQGIIQNQDKIKEGISTVLSHLASFITENAPAIGQAAKSIIDSLSSAFKENAPAIGEAVSTFTQVATEYFISKKELMFQAGYTTFGAVVDGAIQGLFDKISQWTGSISDFFLKPFETFSGTLADEALKNGKMIADKAGEGLDTSQMTFAEKASAFFKHGFNWKEDYAAMARETGTQAANAVGEGVEAGKEGLKSKVDSSVNTAMNGAKTNAQAKGKEIGDAATQGAKDGMANLTPEMAKELEAATIALQQSATNMYNGAKVSFQKLEQVGKQSATNLYNGAGNSFKQLAQVGRQAFSDLYNGSKTSLNSMATAASSSASSVNKSLNSIKGSVNSAISSWRNLRSAFAAPVRVNLQLSKTTTVSTVSKPVTQAHRAAAYNVATYSQNSASALSSGKSEKSNQNMTINVVLDSKTIATQTAPYLYGELNILSKRQNRLGGAF